MYNERQKELIRYLSEVKFAKAEQLAERFQVSLETIRRDLMELEKDSSIRRIRGGAVYSNMRAKELEFAKKMENNQKGKYAIANLAMEYIKDGDAIAMNNGITTLALAKCMQYSRNQLTIVTNSPDIALILSDNESNQVFLTAGYLRKHNKSLIGSMCSESLEFFKVDKTILSIDGISIQDGVTEFNTEEASILRKMLEIGHTKMILCEFSKFSEVAFNKICPARGIDYVFTDWNVPAKDVKAWSDIGVKICFSPKRKDSGCGLQGASEP
ncbi:MAG: DeoR/GlpR transcriptional regulator [Lachnospiraceae bacterium]|nr:DeoR/GlpR transcriptional regulator [Lachnospiraceae bacterium]